MRIGIFGDVHENVSLLREVLNQLKCWGITHLIGTGDFSDDPGSCLARNLSLTYEEIPGISRQSVFLVPGNWDCYFITPHGQRGSFLSEDVVRVLQEYGTPLCNDLHRFGQLTLANTRIIVSHYPQDVVPRCVLPPRCLVYPEPNYPNMLGTMNGRHFSGAANSRSPAAGAQLSITAHTHIHGFYENGGLVEINVGTLSAKKMPQEPFSYGLLDLQKTTIQFIDALQNRPYFEASYNPADFSWNRRFLARERAVTEEWIRQDQRSWEFLPERPFVVPRAAPAAAPPPLPATPATSPPGSASEQQHARVGCWPFGRGRRS